jgi:hypothetical protein
MAELDPFEKYKVKEVEADPFEKYKVPEEDPFAKYKVEPEKEEEQRGKPILDSEIAAIAKKHNLPPEAYVDYLREVVEFRGGSTETPVDAKKALYQTGAFVGESLLFGVPQFLQKKMQDDPRIRAAIDDLGELVEERKTYTRQAAEIGAGLLTGSAEVALAKKGLQAGAKLLGREVAEKAVEKAAVPAAAAAIGATVSVAKSREGEELPAAAVGATIGAVAPYVLGGAVKGLGLIKNKATRDAAEKVAKEVAESPDLVEKVRQEAAKESALTEVVQDLVQKQTARPSDKAISEAINDVGQLTELVGEEKIIKAGQQILSNMSEQTREAAVKELATFDTPAKQMARLVQLKLDEALPRLADELGETAGSARQALQTIATRAGEGAEFISKRYVDALEKRAHSDLVNQRLVEKALANTAEGSTLQNLGRKISDYQFVFRQIDRLRGTRLEPVLNSWNQKYNAFTRHMASAAKDIENVQKVVKESGLTTNELYNALDKPGVIQFGGPKGQAVEAYKQLFDKLREEANALGLSIAKRENYVPHFLKEHVDIARTVRDRVKEIEQRFGVNLANYTQKEYKEAVAKGLSESPLYRELRDGLNYLYGEAIGTPEKLQEFIVQQMNPKSAGTRSFSKAAATYRRTAEEVPLLFRETDVNRLAVRWASTTLKHAYLRNEFANVEKARDMLAQAGFRADAENLTNWLTDNLGGTRANTWRALTQEVQNTLLNMQEKGGRKAQLANWMLEAGPNNFMRLTGAVYPNFLGFNVRSAIQNLTQPFLVTAPELGAQLGPRYILRTFSKMNNMKKMLQDAEQYSAAQWSTELQTVLESGLKRGWIGEKTDAGIRKYTKLAMGMYEVAERANRAFVVSMGREMAKDVLANDKLAMQYVQKMGAGVRREVLAAMANKDSAKVEQLLVNNLLDKTIFQYNRGAMSEFGRAMGPVLSTFSKWPTVLVGDVIDTYERQGAGKGSLDLARKYVGPLALLATMNAAISGGKPFTQEDEQIAATIGGKQGLTSLSPLMSLKQGIGTPPVVQSAAKITEGALTGDMNKVVKGLASVGDAYIPVVPSILRTINDVSKLTEGEEAEVKSLESLFEAVTE